MSKCIKVDHCEKCPFVEFFLGGNKNGYYCKITKNENGDTRRINRVVASSFPDWCPLKDTSPSEDTVPNEDTKINWDNLQDDRYHK